MSFKVVCEFHNEPPTSNSMRYETEKQAQDAGSNLLSRWFFPKGFHVEESEDAVNTDESGNLLSQTSSAPSGA